MEALEQLVSMVQQEPLVLTEVLVLLVSMAQQVLLVSMAQQVLLAQLVQLVLMEVLVQLDQQVQLDSMEALALQVLMEVQVLLV
jgi:hypothetical protein